jgi:hypothetical protein
MSGIRESMIDRYLDPGDSLSEILFGLVMTLSFTLGAGVLVPDSPEAWRELLVATVGCSVAWGIIDAAMHVGAQLFERGRRRRLVHAIRRAADDEKAVRVVAGELGAILEPITSAADRAALYSHIAGYIRETDAEPGALTSTDLGGAAASFVLVCLSSLPAALPFLFVADRFMALRISNALLIALLFFVGYRWAAYTVASPWIVGLVLVVAGVALVAVAILLGG